MTPKQEHPKNPFIIEGYVSPDYFCDREKETDLLLRHLTNGCNVALIAPRRLGKSGLVLNCFHQREIRDNYHCIYIDIYETKNLDEFVYELGKGILAELCSKGRKVWETFLDVVHSLRSTISFDINGNPEWSAGIGDATSSPTTRGCISSATSFSHAILPEETRPQPETERTYRKRRTATGNRKNLPGAEG